MSNRSVRRWGVAVLTAALLTSAAACSTKRDDGSTSSGDQTGTTSAADDATSTELGQGVTADTVKVGFSYVDLETLAKAGVIKIDHGPYADIIKALVGDVNAKGGINGRKIELVTAKFSPIGNTEQLAACSKLTEDEKVFVVLNGLLASNNLCVVQQHATALIGGAATDLTPANLAAAKAPWITAPTTAQRALKALVEVLDENGKLKGKTIGVYAAQSANKPLIDVGTKALEDAGYTVKETALNDAPDDDTQAANAQDKVIAQRFQSAGVDTVIDVGKFIPATTFDGVGYHPSIYTLTTGDIAASAVTNPLAKFPTVGGLMVSNNADAAYDSKAFQACRAVYEKASGVTVKTPAEETKLGKSTGFVALMNACTTMQIFVDGATKAGKYLNNETLAKGVESLGKVELADGTIGSFGPDKLHAQDEFWLGTFNKAWKDGSTENQFEPVGKSVTLDG
jgi:ABC-type branched-subunit amino acid transport system substrate-binding protein